MAAIARSHGSVSAVQPQPRARHADEIWSGTPTAPWGSGRLPSALLADDPQRTLFRTFVRRAARIEVD